MRNPIIALSLAAVFWPVAVANALEDKSFGTWLTDDEKAKVELYPCGDAICSKIVWLKDPVDERGKPYKDELNPDPKLRGRPIMGMDILQNTKKISEKAWTGEIYSPEDGKAYYLKHISLASSKQVEIRGCLSSGWPCRTKYWTRTEPIEPPVIVAAKPAPAPVTASAAPKPTTPPRAYASAPQAVEPAPAPQRQAALTRPAPEPAPAPAQIPPPAPQPQRQAAVTPPPAPTYSPPSQPAPEPQVRRAAPETTAAIPRPAAIAPSSDQGYHVQVLARQTQRDALQAYSEMQQRYPHLLGSISPNVQMADLGAKGVWYRVRVGPIGNQSLAVSFCNRLKSEGADCIVREP